MPRFNLWIVALAVALVVEPGRAADSSFNGAFPANGQAIGGKRTTDGKMVPLAVDGTGALVTAGGGSGSNASVGSNGAVAPASSTQVGWRDGGGNLQPVSVANPLPVSASVTPPSALVDAGNSSTTPLGAGGVFLGTAVDTLAYAAVAYSIQSDVISAVGGIRREWSQDGANWFWFAADALGADRIGVNSGTDMIIRPHARYFRLRYTNGATPQGLFRLQTILYPTIPQGDTIGIDHAPLSGDDALLTKSVIVGKSTAGGGTFVDVKVNPSGALAVDSTGSTVAVTQSTSPWVVSGTVTTADPSVGTNGVAAPGSSTQVAGPDAGGVLRPVGTTASGTQYSLRTIITDTGGADMDLFRSNDLYTAAADHGLLILGQDSGAPARYRPLLTNTAGAVRVDPVGTTPQPVTGTFWQATQPVSGTFWQATQPVSSTQLPAALGPAAATAALATGPSTVATAIDSGTCTNVTTSVTIVPAAAARKVAIIANNGTANVHVKLGATATVANPPLAPGQSLTIDGAAVYTGVIDVIASTGTQSVCAYSW